MKRIVALLLAVIMTFTATGDFYAIDNTMSIGTTATSSAVVPGLGKGLMELELTEVSAEEVMAAEGSMTMIYTSAVYNHEWDKYSTNYTYNLMVDELKPAWDAWDASCRAILNSGADLRSASTDYVLLEGVTDPYIGLYFFEVFKYANPQYYFLANGISYSMTSSGVKVAAKVYNSFMDGDTRTAATRTVKNQIDAWVDIVDDYSAEEDKVKVIHDLVCNKVEYNYDVLADNQITDSEEQVWYTQSAYSVLAMDTTVCAGYTLAFAFIANAVGIDAMGVTGDNHAWNKVSINDSWYNVDCTWDDTGAGYYFFARSDSVVDSQGGHTEYGYWGGLLPPCTLDSGSTNSKFGNTPTITEKTAKPKVTCTQNATGTYDVTISCFTPDASIYYTTDGKVPSSAATRSKYYTKAFEISDPKTLQVIAVCDGYWDSDIAYGNDTGLRQGEDGNWYYYVDGEIDYTYFGLAEYGGYEWYVKDGKLDFSITGAAQCGEEDEWYFFKGGAVQKVSGLYSDSQGYWYVQNGRIQLDYTGLASNSLGWWYVKDGKIDFTKFGVVTYAGKQWYVKGGQVNFNINGLVQCGTSTEWYYFTNGIVQNVTGLYSNSYGWWYVKNGKLDFTFTGLASNSMGWWYVKNGQVDMKYFGVVKSGNTTWYVKNGQVNFNINGLEQCGSSTEWYYFKNGAVQNVTGLYSNSLGWWYVQNGKIVFDYTGLASNSQGWWYVKNGQIDLTYNGVATNASGTWYVEKGKVDFTKSGILSRGSKWYYFKNGAVQRVDTVASNSIGWWAIFNGEVDFTFDGIAGNTAGLWYCVDGKVDFNFTGTTEFNGKTYNVVKGKATLVQ